MRNALTEETHHIKVSDETGGEVYDVTLNSTEPFATPRASTPNNGSASGSAKQDSNSSNKKSDAWKFKGASANSSSPPPPATATSSSSSPQTNPPSSPPVLRPLQLVSKVRSDHTRTNSNGTPIPRSSSPVPTSSNSKSTNIASDSQQPLQQQYTAPTRRHPLLSSELPPSPPLEPDMEMQYRNGNGMSGEMYGNGSGQGYLGQQDSSSIGQQQVDQDQSRKAYHSEISRGNQGNQMGGDVSVPIYPGGAASGHLQEASNGSNNLKRPANNRRNMSTSAASTNTNGTAYATASEDEEEGESKPVAKSAQSTYMTAYQSQPSRQSTQPQPSVLLVPTTAEPISYLHQPEASTSASPAESSSGPQRIQPSRRATTGSPRPPSASSATTQRSSKELTRGVSKGKERSNSTGPGLFGAVPAAAAALGFNSGGPPTSFYEEQASTSMVGASTSGTHLEKTGDADFDEDWLKNIELKKRERQYKRQKEAEAVAQVQAQLQQQPVLVRGKSDAQGVEAPGANLGAALNHIGDGDDGTGDPKIIKGKLIGEDHVNYVLMYNMLTGIRIGVSCWIEWIGGIEDGRLTFFSFFCFSPQVSRCQAKMKRPLTDADYSARHKFTFDM